MNFGGNHPAPGHGNISPRCVPVLPAMAGLCPGAFPGCRPWQDCAPMRSRRGLGREKRPLVATYRRHVFRYSLFWQDMRAMHPKSPAERRWGMHRANILPPRGVFAVRSPQIMHGARILPPSDGLAPCAGDPARAAASRDRLSTAWPLPRGACPPLGAAKAHAARHFPERRRNACRAPFQQMLDAMRCRLSNPYWL